MNVLRIQKVAPDMDDNVAGIYKSTHMMLIESTGPAHINDAKPTSLLKLNRAKNASRRMRSSSGFFSSAALVVVHANFEVFETFLSPATRPRAGWGARIAVGLLLVSRGG